MPIEMFGHSLREAFNSLEWKNKRSEEQDWGYVHIFFFIVLMEISIDFLCSMSAVFSHWYSAAISAFKSEAVDIQRTWMYQKFVRMYQKVVRSPINSYAYFNLILCTSFYKELGGTFTCDQLLSMNDWMLVTKSVPRWIHYAKFYYMTWTRTIILQIGSPLYKPLRVGTL